MYAATMMKRGGVAGIYDVTAAAQDQKLAVSTLPGQGETKVLWISDASTLVGPREEESRRKAPEMKFLYVLSTVLTLMVLYGIFRHIIPESLEGLGLMTPEDAYDIERYEVNGEAFEDDSVGVDFDVRKDARHLLREEVARLVKTHPARKFGIPKARTVRGRTDQFRGIPKARTARGRTSQSDFFNGKSGRSSRSKIHPQASKVYNANGL